MRHRNLQLLLLAIALFLLYPGRAQAVTKDAYRFFQTYSKQTIVAADDNLYFCTRAKLQTVEGYTYHTVGFTIQIRSASGRIQRVQVALGESLKVISTVSRTEDGLPISYRLYELDGESLTRRLKAAYPKENLTPIYASPDPVTLLIDAIMVISLNGTPRGAVTENSKGTVKVTGTVYTDAESIARAVNWAPGNDFTTHFNMLLTLFLERLYPELRVRHISKEYRFTLEGGSRWQSGAAARILKNGLSRTRKTALASWSFSARQISAIRQNLTSQGYASEALNVSFVKKYRISVP